MKIQGKDNIPASSGIILLSNQLNPKTVLVTEAMLQRKVNWAVSSSICQSKLLGLLLKIFWRYFFLNHKCADIKGFRLAFNVLNKKEVLAFYPGGVEQGIALFCIRAGYNILPMAITCDLLHPRRIKIAFGSVYNLNKYQNIMVNVKIVNDIIQRINQSIEELK